MLLLHGAMLLNVYVSCHYNTLKHTTTFFSLCDHYNLCWEWRVFVDQVQTNYHGRPMVLKSVRCVQAADYEGLSLWSDVF